MLLKEMFSPIGAPKDNEQQVDWLDDLKFFIDNSDRILEQHFFPAIKRHEQHIGNPSVFKVYIRPIQIALENYCDKYDIGNKEEKFTKEKLIDLAKKIAAEQEIHIKEGDYK
jgi:hypothetical protein